MTSDDSAASDPYRLARLHVSASPLFLREAEVARGVDLLMLGQAQLAAAALPLLREKGLGAGHWRLLGPVVRWPGQTMSDMIALIGTSKQGMTRLARDLEAAGMIETRPGTRDRRQRLLIPTATGQALARAVEAAMATAMGSAYGVAGQDAVTGFWHVLEGLVPVSLRMRMAEWDSGRG